MRPMRRRPIVVTVALAAATAMLVASPAEAAVLPLPGTIIVNEIQASNGPGTNDFFELLTLAEGLDLRGLRVSDNEIVGGALNNNESVFVFGTDAALANVPCGTAIAVWTQSAGITADLDPTDGSLTLVPGTGVTATVDGLGGSVNTGLSTGGEALYAYLPDADSSSVNPNTYLDFIRTLSAVADAPAGIADVNINGINTQFKGTTAAQADIAANWATSPDLTTIAPTPGALNVAAGQSAPPCSTTGIPMTNLPAAALGVVAVTVAGVTTSRRRRRSTPSN